MRSPDLSVRRRQRGIPEDAIVANLLALGSLLATVVAFMTAFSVLGSYDYANKFENGALPPGTDGHVALFTVALAF